MATRITHTAPQARDFSAEVRRALLAKGVRIIGIQALPDMTISMPWANAQTGYCLDDNGTHRILTYFQVKALAK